MQRNGHLIDTQLAGFLDQTCKQSAFSEIGFAQAAAYYPQKTEDAAVAILAMAFSSYSLTSLRKVLLLADIGPNSCEHIAAHIIPHTILLSASVASYTVLRSSPVVHK